jgi:hypothetical protein
MSVADEMARDGDPGSPTPEQAAVESFPPLAKARVVRVLKVDDRYVQVIVDTEPSHQMRVHCEKSGELWYVTADGNDV